MRKLLLFGTALIQFSNASAQTSNAAPYCKPVFQNTASGNVIGQIDLTSLGSSMNVSGTTNPGYTFYNNIAPIQLSVSKGTLPYTYIGPFGLGQSSGTGKAQYLNIYIDFNHDGKFDASEQHSDMPTLGMGAVYSYLPNTNDSTYYGMTRMRVIWSNDQTGDPCNNNTSFVYNGEVEDYLAYVSYALPIVKGTGATNITGNSATLNGTVYVNGPNAAATSFEYGQTTAYTNAIITGNLPADTTGTVKTLTTNISGLSPYTIYHYRLKAFNGKDTMYSKDQTFVTTAPSGIIGTNSGSAVIVSRPATNAVMVQGLPADRQYALTITDVNGKLVANSVVANGQVVTLQSAAPGVYFLRIVSTSGEALLFRDKLLFY